MGGRTGHQRACVLLAPGRGTAGISASGLLAACRAGRTGGALHARAGGGAFMDTGACRALMDSKPAAGSCASGAR